MPEITATSSFDEPASEARVIVNGEPVEGPDPLFIGALDEAIEYVHGLSPEQQAEVSIFTEGRVYNPNEV